MYNQNLKQLLGL